MTGRHRAMNEHRARTQGYVWLGAGAITLGVGAATLASGSGVAHADTAPGNSSPSKESSSSHITSVKVGAPNSAPSSSGNTSNPAAASKSSNATPTAAHIVTAAAHKAPGGLTTIRTVLSANTVSSRSASPALATMSGTRRSVSTAAVPSAGAAISEVVSVGRQLVQLSGAATPTGAVTNLQTGVNAVSHGHPVSGLLEVASGGASLAAYGAALVPGLQAAAPVLAGASVAFKAADVLGTAILHIGTQRHRP
ncbi:hypothetical protein BH09ACT7_BH09ACT7_60380 [soil metagenome]